MTGSDSEEDEDDDEDEDEDDTLRERMACMVQLGTRGEKTTCEGEERDAMLMRSGPMMLRSRK